MAEEAARGQFVMTTTDGAGLNVVRFLGIVNAKEKFEERGFIGQMLNVQRQLHEQAIAIGANAIIGLRLETNGYSGSCFGYGTAVIYEPRPTVAEAKPAADEAPEVIPPTPDTEPATPLAVPKPPRAPSTADEGGAYVFPQI